MTAAIADRFKIIDVDTHVIEPPDLWTSRMPKRSADRVPHIETDSRTGDDIWVMGNKPMARPGLFAQAGWNEHPPLHPPTWADIDPATWDAKLRLQRMDEFGVFAQILYPNLSLFYPGLVLDKAADLEFTFEYVRAYNDYQTEWCSAAPDRLIPVTSVPLWDRDESIAEMERCHSMGHRGVIFSQEPGAWGLPMLTDPHWDPFWSAAQEMGIPVNFHIGSAADDVDDTSLAGNGHASCGMHANTAVVHPAMWFANATTMAKLICGGICHRFPRLNFVLVESGVSWIPFALEGLDWAWGNSGVKAEHPEYELLPSEYFKRQIYGCFFFESFQAVQYSIERLGDQQILFETDFPHPTAQVPGPGVGVSARDFVEREFTQLSDTSLARILHDNAARLYGL
jgi:predicted TIM-barrel fold metal-dependent hydrolase